eukprot:4842449-Pyramimonas_sp.AAC.1
MAPPPDPSKMAGTSSLLKAVVNGRVLSSDAGMLPTEGAQLCRHMTSSLMVASCWAYPSALVALGTLPLRAAEPPEGWQKKNTASLAVL